MIFRKHRPYLAPDGGAEGGAAGGTPQGNGGDAGAQGGGKAGGAGLQDIMEGKAAEKPSTQTDDKGGDGKGDGSAPDTPAWMKQLTEDMRADSELAKFQNLKDFVSAYKELAKARGEGVSLPPADAKPEEVQAFYEKLGKPKTADAYGVKAADGADTSVFRQAAFDANLTDAQAQAMFAAFETKGREMLAERADALKRQYAETEDALRKEYGDKYDEKQVLLKRGLTTFCGPELTRKLVSSGLTADPDVVRLFIRLGEMNAEAGTVARGAQGNAYRSVAEGGSFAFKGL